MDERAYELAAQLELGERQHGIAAVQAALQAAGRAYCAACDEPIPAARLAAYPAARRCIECQHLEETR